MSRWSVNDKFVKRPAPTYVEHEKTGETIHVRESRRRASLPVNMRPHLLNHVQRSDGAVFRVGDRVLIEGPIPLRAAASPFEITKLIAYPERDAVYALVEWRGHGRGFITSPRDVDELRHLPAEGYR